MGTAPSKTGPGVGQRCLGRALPGILHLIVLVDPHGYQKQHGIIEDVDFGVVGNWFKLVRLAGSVLIAAVDVAMGLAVSGLQIVEALVSSQTATIPLLAVARVT